MPKKELNVVMCVYENKKYTLNKISRFNAHLIIIMINKAFDLNVIMTKFFLPKYTANACRIAISGSNDLMFENRKEVARKIIHLYSSEKPLN